MLYKRYVYRFICAFLMTVIAAGSYFYVWYGFVLENNKTGSLLGLGNLTMAISAYIFLFLLIGYWLRTFKIGFERKAKSIVSVALTVIIVDTIEIFVSMAITGQFRFIIDFTWRYALLSIAQSIVLGLLMMVMVNVYRIIIPPLTVVEITGEHHNNLTNNLMQIKNKYSLKETLCYTISQSELIKKIRQYDAVLINDVPIDAERDILKICFDLDKRVYVLPKISDIILKSSENLNIVDTPLCLCRNLRINIRQRFVKRAFDIIASFLALVLFAPVMLITAIAIKLEDRGPVFFKQERVTLDGKLFMILKFRSMIVDAEKDGRPHPAGEKDSRITRVGRIIRMCRIDELPQLINILKGDMSVVGPRPERREHVDEYIKIIPEFSFRHKVKGGLTGYAQVYGKYNTTALDKLKMDLIYITNYSFILDLHILFETIKILFLKESTEGFGEDEINKIHDSSNNFG